MKPTRIMAELKTTRSAASVARFLRGIRDAQQRRDAKQLAALMRRLTGATPRMWGSGIVGFGSYCYKYPSGREGEWFRTGFAPRKANLTVYVMSGFTAHMSLLKRLGRCKTGKSCLYVRQLADIDLRVLERLLSDSLRDLDRRWPPSRPGPRRAVSRPGHSGATGQAERRPSG